MKKETIELGYQHPEMRVVPLMGRSVLCQSIVEKYEIDDSLGDSNFD